jgi:hypothetical protein
VLHYAYYTHKTELLHQLLSNDNIQCVSARKNSVDIPQVLPFGNNQQPSLFDYVDGVDTMQFLESLLKLLFLYPLQSINVEYKILFTPVIIFCQIQLPSCLQ